MNKLKHLLFLVFFGIIHFCSFAADENLINGETLNNIDTETEISVRDSWYLQYILGSDDDYFTTESSEATVKLWFDDSEKTYYASADSWQVDITYDLVLTKTDGDEVTHLGETLSIDYHETNPYKDIHLKVYDSHQYIKAVVSNISVVATDLTTTPSDIHLDVELNAVRYYNLDTDETTTPSHQPVDRDGDLSDYEEVLVTWPFVEGAESYDLEWLFIDEPEAGLTGLAGTYYFRDASRVNVLTTDYNISLAYPRGLFIFRVRPVGKKVVGGKVVRVEGAWSRPDVISDDDIHYPSSPSVSELGSSEKFAFDGLMTDKNWQYQASFVEEGKKGEVLGVYDGSLKPRQNITINNADDNVIINQVIYDYLGRPAISLLPVPEENKGLGFYPLRTLISDGSGSFYDYDNFDTDTKIDAPDNMDNTLVNNYYNSNGTAVGVGADYIADAEDYPFARTTFTRDGTGKVRTQSAVGNTTIGSSSPTTGKITRYYYATPTQEELYRLFGNEVGNALHYKKNVLIDPNGQAHIQILDISGRIIATALAGDAPTNLLEIDSYPESFDVITADLTVNNTFNEDGELVINKKIVVPYTTNYDFSYGLADILYDDPCLDLNSITEPVDLIKYDVTIYIEDENYNRMIIPGYGEEFSSSAEGITEIDPNETFTVNLPDGEYTITKVLKINEAYVEVLKAYFYENQTCFDLTITEGSPCNPTCEDLCFSGYGFINADDQKVYIGEDGNFVAIEVGVDSYSYYPGYNYDSLSPILSAIAACEVSCDKGVTAALELDPCEQKLQDMLADMSPGGQYFDNTTFGSFEPVGGDINGWLIAAGIDPDEVTGGTGTTWADVRAEWEDSDASLLLPHHPEYCVYVLSCGSENFCGANYTGTDPACSTAVVVGAIPDYSGYTGLMTVGAYNALASSTSDATGSTFLFNPTNKANSTFTATATDKRNYQNYTAGLPDGEIDPFVAGRGFLRCEIENMLEEYLDVYGDGSEYHSIWFVIEDPLGIHTGGSGYPAEIEELYQVLHGDGVDPGIIGVEMTKYEFFRSAYLFIRNYVAYESIGKFTFTGSPCPAACATGMSRITSPGDNGLSAAGFYIHFPENKVFDDYTGGITLAAVEAEIATECAEQCEDYAVSWLAEFGSCAASASDLDIAIDYMTDICSESCDETTPYGTDDMSPDDVPTDYGWGTSFSTFEDVINHLNSLNPANDCAVIEHPFTAPNELNSNCECNGVNGFMEEFYINNGVAVPADGIYNLTVQLSASQQDDLLDQINENLSDTETDYTDLTVMQGWLDACDGTPGTLVDLMDAFTCGDLPDVADFDTDCGDLLDALENHFEEKAFGDLIEKTWKNYLANYTAKAWENINIREVFTMAYDLHEYHYTLFYYDQAGNLIKTVPPAGIYRKERKDALDVVFEEGHSSTLTTAEIQLCKDHISDPVANAYFHPNHKLATNYKYNSLQQLMEQSTPDGGTTVYWYDALGRLVASRNARQVVDNAYSYTLYDDLGRVVEAGEISSVTTPLTDGIATDNDLYNGWIAGGTREEVVRTIYNGYQQTTNEVEMALGVDLTNEVERLNLRSRIGSVVYYYGEYDPDDIEFDPDEFDYAIHYNYDYAGNVKTVVQENGLLASQLSGEDALNYVEFVRTDYTYDLISGNVIQVNYQEGKPDEFHYKYDYDANNRLTVSYSSYDGRIWEKESKNFYYAHGPLARQEIGDEIVQACDYVYTVNGWLKAVNSTVNHQDNDAGHDGKTGTINEYGGRDAHGFSLHYYGGDYQAVNATASEDLLVNITNTTFGNSTHDLYNGNIHQMVTSLNDYNENGLGILANKYRYDQLQRIKSSDVFESNTPNAIRSENAITDLNANNTAGNYKTSYTFDGNGNLLSLNRANSSGVDMDNFEYHYNYDPTPGGTTTNQLNWIFDDISPTVSTVDVDAHAHTDNYQYDAIGQLIKDKANDIDNIEWTVTGKVKKIIYDDDLNTALETNVADVTFEYDPMGMRVSKKVHTVTTVMVGEIPGTIDETVTTYYMYDASGNVLATYDHKDAPVSFKLNEHHLYGSKRLGTTNRTIDMNIDSYMESELSSRILGEKSYELSNHLGNVLATVSDRKLAVEHDLLAGVVDHYEADVQSYSEYYPYGMVLRSGTDGSSYRYGFQGQEDDPELKGEGNSTNYKYRMHDPRIGRFFAVDPLTSKYPEWTPYQFDGNMPTRYVELEGLEPGFDGTKLNQTELASDKSPGNEGHVYNYTWTNLESGELGWSRGTEYTGPTVGEAALISDHVYTIDKDYVSVGNEVGVTKWTLETKYIDENFKGGTYRKSIEGINFYVFATAGTDDLSDGYEDVAQALGSKSGFGSYKKSLDIAQDLSADITSRSGYNYLSFVGHSLGGGMASLNSLKTGHSAITFNAAALSYNIKSWSGTLNKQALINAYVVKGEAVDHYQSEILGLKAEGTIHSLSPVTKIMSYEDWIMGPGRTIMYYGAMMDHGSGGFATAKAVHDGYSSYSLPLRVKRHLMSEVFKSLGM